MQAWFVSDIHLKDINERNSVILLRFLHSLLEDSKTTHLFLLGDIFDLWFGDSIVFQRKFQALIDAIADLKRKGVEVVYFEGNHDLHMQKFWEEKLAIPVWDDFRIYSLGPYQVRLEHGDFINPNDEAYLKFRKFMRSEGMKKVADWLPGRIIDELGTRASKLSRQHSSGYRRDSEEFLRQMIRKFAETRSQQSPFDYIITGHMHVRDEYTFESEGRKKISINLGSWFDEPCALMLSEQGHFWKKL